MSDSLVLAASTGGAHLGLFGRDPGWLILLKALAIFVFLLVTTLLQIWAERRILGRMQQRPGPNRVGPFGLLQSLADGVKLMLKEDLIPAIVDRPLYILAPLVAVIPAFLSFAVIPVGPVVSIFGHHTPLQLTDLSVAVLFVLAMASVGVYGIVLAGWSSQSPYPLLGALRSAAQVISYEVAMGLALAAVFLYSGSLSTSEIVASQSLWYALPLFPSFAMYLVAMVGETNRAPFDLPEAETELVAGFHTEYGSIKFAMFFLAEYINVTTVAALATTLFLGGWHAPWPLGGPIWPGANSGWWPVLWFLGKVVLIIFAVYWLRGTLPRLRYDQFMALGWKVLIPTSLVWIMIVAAFRQLNNQGHTRLQTLAYVGIPLAVVILVASFVTENKAVIAEEEEELEPPHGAYPVPVLTGGAPVHETTVANRGTTEVIRD